MHLHRELRTPRVGEPHLDDVAPAHRLDAVVEVEVDVLRVLLMAAVVWAVLLELEPRWRAPTALVDVCGFRVRHREVHVRRAVTPRDHELEHARADAAALVDHAVAI